MPPTSCQRIYAWPATCAGLQALIIVLPTCFVTLAYTQRIDVAVAAQAESSALDAKAASLTTKRARLEAITDALRAQLNAPARARRRPHSCCCCCRACCFCRWRWRACCSTASVMQALRLRRHRWGIACYSAGVAHCERAHTASWQPCVLYK
ncbi:hypothetical protein JKP88DRAFT_251994 [Tribonema minus]|uniref:Uncharacterized protein n=1 Tax=Tribonema minus TaxID=303371 RepID=A0A836CPE4_9STRA|nr:hypothetical protein JKP88DRAFT_251994 [Tribonema minus]